MTVANSVTPAAAIFGLAGIAVTPAERAFFQRVRPAGYILFARNVQDPAQLRALVDELRALVPDHDPLVLIDQEGGRVQRLKPPHWRAAPPMARFGALYARDRAEAHRLLRLNMQAIGEELAALGIDVDCAPVMDVPVAGAHDIIGDRAFARDPAVVADLAVTACDGLAAAGVVPVIKHIPGHGRARADSHLELPVVDTDRATLERTDFVPFAAFGRSGRVAFGMTAHVVYSAIDPDAPATNSSRVIGDVIRGALGFDGLLMSDDLGMKALTGPFDQRAAAAIAAGCDVALHCDGNLADMEAVARGIGRMSAEAMRRLAAAAPIRRKPASAVPPNAVAEINAGLVHA